MYNNPNKNNDRGNHQAPLFGRPPQQAGQQQQGGGGASFGFASGAPSSFGAVRATPAPLQGTGSGFGAGFGFGKTHLPPQQSQQPQQQKPRRLDIRDFADKPIATPAYSQPQSASAASNNDSATTFFPRTLIPRSTHTPTPQQSQQQQQKQQLSSSALGGAPSYSFGNSFSSAAPTTTTNTRPSFFHTLDVDPTATGADLVAPAHLRQAQPKLREFTAALDVQIAARGQPQAKPWQRPRKSYEDDSMDLDDEPTVPYPEAGIEVEREAQAARNGTNKSVELVVVPETPTPSGSGFSASATVRPIATAFEPHRPMQSSLSSSSSSSASSQMSKGLQTPAPNAAAAQLNRGMRSLTIQTPDGGPLVRPDATVRKPDGRYLANFRAPAPAKFSAHADRSNRRPELGAYRMRIDGNSGETDELPSAKCASAAPPVYEVEERCMRRSFNPLPPAR